MRPRCRKAILLLVAVVGAPWVLMIARANAVGPTSARLYWLGQSCFLLESPGGTRVVMDPPSGSAALGVPEDLSADLVTISHEHDDHNNLAVVKGTPRVFRGLTRDRKGWLKIRETVKDVSVRTVGVYHDENAGSARGLNTVFVFETGGLRIAHLGDLGHPLNDRQLSELGSVDVVLIPVGGADTMNADGASRVIDQLRPRLIVVPMHYQSSKDQEGGQGDLSGVEAFLAGRPHVRRESGNVIEITPLKKRPGAEVVVLNHP